MGQTMPSMFNDANLLLKLRHIMNPRFMASITDHQRTVDERLRFEYMIMHRAHKLLEDPDINIFMITETIEDEVVDAEDDVLGKLTQLDKVPLRDELSAARFFWEVDQLLWNRWEGTLWPWHCEPEPRLYTTSHEGGPRCYKWMCEIYDDLLSDEWQREMFYRLQQA